MPQPPNTPVRSTPPSRLRWIRILLALSLFGVVVLVVLVQRRLRVEPPEEIGCEHGRHEWGPDDGLRTIGTSAITYWSTYENGYPPSLASIGPSESGNEYTCRAAGLIDKAMASGEKWGYVFEYIPGPPVDKPAPGCPPGVKSYTVTARPLKYGQTGRCSYYTDDTLLMTFTDEDRPATPQDCCINSYMCEDCKPIPEYK